MSATSREFKKKEFVGKKGQKKQTKFHKPQVGITNKGNMIDHEIISTVILSLPLIQEGQLSVSGERMCTILVNRLED